MRKFFLLLLAAGSIAASSKGQGSCGTDDIYQVLKFQHPEITVFEQQLEEATKAAINHADISKMAKLTSSYSDTATYDIPIVIHVVHDYGAEYLNDDAIYAAVQHWAQVYMARNTDTADVIAPFKKYVGDARIRLHLATIDPNGNPTKGITHARSYLTTNAGDEAKVGGWPQDKYLNLWFINKFNSAMSGAAAYAYYPSSAAYMPYYDGVIGLFNYLDYDKAIPHEIGHVLNLEHTWGNTNNPGVACGDDNVDDTPPTMGHNPVGCAASALYDVACASSYSKTYKDIYGLDSLVDYPDTVNAQNIMDYTYCQKMFTIGQVQRMRVALTASIASRSNLITAANLAATGALAPMPDLPPVADFSVEKGTPITADKLYFLSLGSSYSFTFKNRSWNDTITDVAWTFSNGAVTPTSIANTVTNKFSQKGWVTVSITANGNNTGSNTYTDSQAVYVADSVAMSTWGYVQDFSSAAAMSNWPVFNYYKNNFKWELYSGAGYGDNSCLRYRSYDYRTSPSNKVGTAAGDYDDIISPAFNMAGLSSSNGKVNINFYAAGSYKTGSTPADSLQVLVSNNGGVNWTKIGSLKGTALFNNTAKNSEFIPNATQWKAQTVSVPATYCGNHTFVKLRYWPSNTGNNLYIDNIQISPYTTEVNEVAQNASLIKIFPNPAHNSCKIACTTGSDGKVQFIVHDMTGRLVYNSEETHSPNSLIEKDINNQMLTGSGIYLVTVIIANRTITEKLVMD